MFKLHIITVIIITWYEIDADDNDTTIADKLDFWEPDPKFEARRIYGSQNNKIDNSRESKLPYRNYINRYTRRTSGNTTSRYGLRARIGRMRFDNPRGPGHAFQRSVEVNNQPLKEDRGTWPRQRRLRHRNKNRDGELSHPAQSTRMTPMYLMQHPLEPPVTTTTKPLAESSEEPENIRPYVIQSQMQRILSRFPDVNASIEVLGRTVEYNEIVLVKMSAQMSEIGKYFRAEESKYIEEVPGKKIIFIVHGLSVIGMRKLAVMHQENYFEQLLGYYIAHLDKYDIFLIPMANPDGFTAAQGRTLWNKNLSPQSACSGVALDRNFDVAWGTGKIYDSCSQMYAGPSAFSEAETKAIRDVLHHYGHKIHAYIHVHAGSMDDDIFKGDAVLYPKGYTEVQSDDDKYIDLRGEIDEALKNASFQVVTVTVDTLHNWYGKVTGSSVDYASSIYGIPYAMEFVMQVYAMSGFNISDDRHDYFALTEIWRRVIDVVFNNMWRNMQELK